MEDPATKVIPAQQIAPRLHEQLCAMESKCVALIVDKFNEQVRSHDASNGPTIKSFIYIGNEHDYFRCTDAVKNKIKQAIQNAGYKNVTVYIYNVKPDEPNMLSSLHQLSGGDPFYYMLIVPIVLDIAMYPVRKLINGVKMQRYTEKLSTSPIYRVDVTVTVPPVECPPSYDP